MLNNKILINNGFVYKQIEIDEYGHTIIEKRWYFGPYIYLTKVNSRYCVNWIYNTECPKYLKYFNEDTIKINEILEYCKSKYMDLHKKLTDKIVKLEVEQEKIMNYVF